ncbi:MAG: ATPase domain-containing protein [Candidatus Micrarchaeota archaeon]
MDRVKTGISGLDEILNGGIPLRRHVAVYGGPGAGKSSFCFEYLYRGAQMGENGVYITLEETPEDFLSNMSSAFAGFTDMDKLVKKGNLDVVKPDKLEIESVAEVLEESISKNEVKRAVVDSATMIRMSFKDVSDYRQTIFEFFSLLRNLDCTAMMTVEAPGQDLAASGFEIEHYVMDGIINLYNLGKAETRIKALEVYKMRGTDHVRDKVPYKITPDGIKIYVGEKIF